MPRRCCDEHAHRRSPSRYHDGRALTPGAALVDNHDDLAEHLLAPQAVVATTIWRKRSCPIRSESLASCGFPRWPPQNSAVRRTATGSAWRAAGFYDTVRARLRMRAPTFPRKTGAWRLRHLLLGREPLADHWGEACFITPSACWCSIVPESWLASQPFRSWPAARCIWPGSTVPPRTCGGLR